MFLHNHISKEELPKSCAQCAILALGKDITLMEGHINGLMKSNKELSAFVSESILIEEEHQPVHDFMIKYSDYVKKVMDYIHKTSKPSEKK